MIANSRHDPLSRPDHKIVDRTKIRDGAVANRPIYVALAVTTEGRREILGLWAGDGGEGAKHWLHILTEVKNRGVSARARSYASAASVNSCFSRSQQACRYRRRSSEGGPRLPIGSSGWRSSRRCGCPGPWRPRGGATIALGRRP